jgi:hypothetical protein
MHELSVALSTLEVAAEEAERHGSARVGAIQPGGHWIEVVAPWLIPRENVSCVCSAFARP